MRRKRRKKPTIGNNKHQFVANIVVGNKNNVANNNNIKLTTYFCLNDSKESNLNLKGTSSQQITRPIATCFSFTNNNLTIRRKVYRSRHIATLDLLHFRFALALVVAMSLILPFVASEKSESNNANNSSTYIHSLNFKQYKQESTSVISKITKENNERTKDDYTETTNITQEEEEEKDNELLKIDERKQEFSDSINVINKFGTNNSNCLHSLNLKNNKTISAIQTNQSTEGKFIFLLI